MRPGLAAIVPHLIAAAIILVIEVPHLSTPFDCDLEGMNGAVLQGSIQKNYERLGFWNVSGAPAVSAVPGSPPLLVNYLHHPPLAFWMVRPFVLSFGLHEWTLRLPSVLCSIATAMLLIRIAGQVAGPSARWAAAVTFPLLPIVARFDRMPGFEPPMLFAATAAFAALVMNASPRRQVLVALLLLVAAWVDWVAAFLVPAFLVHEWIVVGRRPSLRIALRLGLAVVAGATAYVVLAIVWFGSPGELIHHLHATMASTVSFIGVHPSLADCLAQFWRHLEHGFGWPTLLVAAAGCATAFSWRRSNPRGSAAIAAWIIVGVLNVAVFPVRAFVHDYWWYFLVPAVVLAVGCFVERAAQSRSRARRVATLLVALVALCFGARSAFRGGEDRGAPANGPLTTAINQHFDSDSLVVCPGANWFWTRTMYTVPWTLPDPWELENVDRYIDDFRRGRFAVRQLVVLGTDGAGTDLAHLPADLIARMRAAGMESTELAPGILAFTLRR